MGYDPGSENRCGGEPVWILTRSGLPPMISSSAVRQTAVNAVPRGYGSSVDCSSPTRLPSRMSIAGQSFWGRTLLIPGSKHHTEPSDEASNDPLAAAGPLDTAVTTPSL